MADLPIAIVEEKRIYDNTPTTVFVLASNVAGELLIIRRAKQPGYGLLGLPGGYQMRGETWQEAGTRELLEETGCHLDPSSLQFVSIRTDDYKNNLIIARPEFAQACILHPESCIDSGIDCSDGLPGTKRTFVECPWHRGETRLQVAISKVLVVVKELVTTVPGAVDSWSHARFL